MRGKNVYVDRTLMRAGSLAFDFDFRKKLSIARHGNIMAFNLNLPSALSFLVMAPSLQ
jgi:hypothetical protein